MVETDPGVHAIVYRLTAEPLLSRPPRDTNKAILYVSHESADDELRNERLIRDLIEADPDAAFYTCDVRGVGDSEPQTTSVNDRGEYSTDYFYSSHALMLDYPYVGQRTFDVLRVLDWLNAWGYGQIHLAAKGYGALPVDVRRAALASRGSGDAEERLELVRRGRGSQGLQLAAVGVAGRRADQLRPAGLLSGIEEEEPEAAGTVGRQPGVGTCGGAAPVVLATGVRPCRHATGIARSVLCASGAVVELNDSRNQTTVSILPALGNLAVEMKVKGHNVLRFPFTSAADYKGGTGSIGIPFLAPWADRLDEQAFYANGKRYAFDMTLGNVRGTNPIHGFLSSVPDWNVVEARADGQSAWVTSRLEFFKHPHWMKQFPFAHTIEMTHRLRDGVLEVATRIDNLSVEPMPVAIGFHPFFQLTDSPRDEWTLSVAARTHWPVSEAKMPTGVHATHRKVLCRPGGGSAGAARARRCVQRPRAGCTRPGDDVAERQSAAA